MSAEESNSATRYITNPSTGKTYNANKCTVVRRSESRPGTAGSVGVSSSSLPRDGPSPQHVVPAGRSYQDIHRAAEAVHVRPVPASRPSSLVADNFPLEQPKMGKRVNHSLRDRRCEEQPWRRKPIVDTIFRGNIRFENDMVVVVGESQRQQQLSAESPGRPRAYKGRESVAQPQPAVDRSYRPLAPFATD